MNELYNTNADFKRYVDRYCKTYGLTVEEALEHELVKQVAAQYREKEEARIK